MVLLLEADNQSRVDPGVVTSVGCKCAANMQESWKTAASFKPQAASR
tara:strand:- start:25768 stop:25908 length:141 start_codon:yes stop_codon:yes gene_type:complete